MGSADPCPMGDIMNARMKVLLLPAAPMLGALMLVAPVGAAARPHGPLVPHMPAVVHAAAARPRVVTGTHQNTYVSTKGTDVANTCSNKAKPCATFTYAETKTASGGTINVANGTYHQSVDLTQPIRLLGQSMGSTILYGTNVDYTLGGYYGIIGINNTSGVAGTIAISNVTVTHPYITAAEANLVQSPVDITNYDQKTGDKVNVTSVTLGPAQDEVDFPGIGYYSLNALSTNSVKQSRAHGMYTAYFDEGSGGPTSYSKDLAYNLAGDTYQGTYYPAAGVWALADTSGSQTVTANNNQFKFFNGWGIVGQAGYSGGNCTNNVCTGGLTINTNHNFFDLYKAPAGDGVAAIQAYVSANDSLTGNFNNSSGIVFNPDLAISVVNFGGVVNVTDTHNTITVLN